MGCIQRNRRCRNLPSPNDSERLKAGRTSAPDLDPVKPVDDKIVAATVVHCTKVVADMVKVQRLTGMRPAEVCALTPGMIDRSKDHWVAKFRDHKTAWRGKERIVMIGPQAQAVLRPYLLRASDQPCFSPAESKNQMREKSGMLNVSHLTDMETPLEPIEFDGQRRCAGAGYTTCSYRRAIWRACEKAFPLGEKQQRLNLSFGKRSSVESKPTSAHGWHRSPQAIRNRRSSTASWS